METQTGKEDASGQSDSNGRLAAVQFEQYMTAIYRNGKCFRDVYSDRDEEVAHHAWIWSRKALESSNSPEAANAKLSTSQQRKEKP